MAHTLRNHLSYLTALMTLESGFRMLLAFTCLAFTCIHSSNEQNMELFGLAVFCMKLFSSFAAVAVVVVLPQMPEDDLRSVGAVRGRHSHS